MDQGTRETFGSSWGTILSTAGVAIGLGNIWRFPYMMGRFGGSTFLILYLLVVFSLGVPALMCEWALGRETRRGPMGAFSRAGLPGGRWWGYLLLLTIVMASSYYVVILGWVLYYARIFAFSANTLPSQALFEGLIQSLPTQFLYVLACIIMGCVSLGFGVKKGIERVSTLVTPLFFLLFAFLILRTLTLEGAMEALVAFLRPDWGQLSARSLLAAMGQGLFSLSVGGTFMLIYGSYLRPQENIPRGALWTASLDVSAALAASLIIVPGVLVFGIDMASGPPLMFVVLPEVFRHLPWGNLFGTLFFVSVFLVAMLSLLGAYEVLVGGFQDAWGWSRNRSLALILLVETLIILPPMLSVDYIFTSDLIWGSTMQPFGAALSVIALAWCIGRGRTLEQLKRHSRLPVSPFLFYWIKYVVPIAILLGLIYGWIG